MSQQVNENITDIEGINEASAKKKNKKAKEFNCTAENAELTVESDRPNDCKEHANSKSVKLTNGSCEHSEKTSEDRCSNSSNEDNKDLKTVPNQSCDNDESKDKSVNNIYLSRVSEDIDQEKVCHNESCQSKMHLTKDLVEEALQNLETTLNLKTSRTDEDIEYVSYESELQMAEIMRLIQKDLSEPYSIYTYRYFIHNWPKLCFLAMHEGKCIGAIVCKLDIHRKVVKRGYIAMLAVDEKYRKRKIGSRLVRQAIQVMIDDDADEVVLETEITNKPALRLYENLGFVRDKRLFRYYLNGVDALRLKLWLR